MKKQPIIIIGMHRSGTSMLTRFINDLGVFMGNDKSENDESKFFQKLNKWLLYQLGASWDVPQPTNFIDQTFVDKASKLVLKRMNSFWCKEYLGTKNYLKYRQISNMNNIWGWKDPRNTLLLPIYKNIFPEAKIVHIYRNPVDVAVSLQAREFQKKKEPFSKKDRIKFNFLLHQRLISHSLVVEDLKEGVNLWEYYTQKALEASSVFSNTINIKYEEFLKKPEQTLLELTSFLGIEPNNTLINSVLKKVDSDRRYAFITDDKLVALYNDIKDRPLMKQLGYNNIK